jgi:hypothetical protein
MFLIQHQDAKIVQLKIATMVENIAELLLAFHKFRMQENS